VRGRLAFSEGGRGRCKLLVGMVLSGFGRWTLWTTWTAWDFVDGIKSRLQERNRLAFCARAPQSRPNAERRTPNAERRTPNAERRTPNAERRTPNAERRTPNAPPILFFHLLPSALPHTFRTFDNLIRADRKAGSLKRWENPWL
jgi:hypothetical protein